MPKMEPDLAARMAASPVASCFGNKRWPPEKPTGQRLPQAGIKALQQIENT